MQYDNRRLRMICSLRCFLYKNDKKESYSLLFYYFCHNFKKINTHYYINIALWKITYK